MNSHLIVYSVNTTNNKILSSIYVRGMSFLASSSPAACSILKINPLAHNNAGFELDYYLIFIDVSDRLQQPRDKVIINFLL